VSEKQHQSKGDPFDKYRKQPEEEPFTFEPEDDCDIHISSNYEIISVNWIDTPNWMIHPFFSEVVKKATLSGSESGFHIINIERRIWDRAISKLLAKSLEIFENKMLRKGVNTRKEMGEYLDSILEEVQ